MTAEEIRLVETHPSRGMEILSRSTSVSDDIVQIVHQHHEREFGTGYPSKLPKGKIHPIAKLIAVSDEFCMMAIKNPDSDGMDPKTAFTRLATIQGNSLDSTFIGALAKVLKVEIPGDTKNKKTETKAGSAVSLTLGRVRRAA